MMPLVKFFFPLEYTTETLAGAAYDGHFYLTQAILKVKEVDPNLACSSGATPLYLACQQGHLEVVRLLLADSRVDINLACDVGATPLYLACQQGHLEVVRLLLADSRVDINLTCDAGATPLYIACEQGHLEVVQLLLADSRIDPSMASNTGATPFYVACQQRNLEIVQLLLVDSRIDPNIESNVGATPFYVACENRNLEVVRLLISDSRVNLGVVNNKGLTAIQCLQHFGMDDLVEYVELENSKRQDIEALEEARLLTERILAVRDGKIFDDDILPADSFTEPVTAVGWENDPAIIDLRERAEELAIPVLVNIETAIETAEERELADLRERLADLKVALRIRRLSATFLRIDGLNPVANSQTHKANRPVQNSLLSQTGYLVGLTTAFVGATFIALRNIVSYEKDEENTP